MSKSITTTVDIVIRIEVVGEPADVENCRSALDCLADVMAVQAEDGLWSLGREGAENADGSSEPVATIMSTKVHAVLIDGVDALTKDLVTYKIIHVKHPGMSWDLVENDWRPGNGSTFKSRNQAAKTIVELALPDAQIRRCP